MSYRLARRALLEFIRSIGAWEAPHGKFDPVIGEDPPGLDFAPIGCLGVFFEEFACLFPGFTPWQSPALALPGGLIGIGGLFFPIFVRTPCVRNRTGCGMVPGF